MTATLENVRNMNKVCQKFASSYRLNGWMTKPDRGIGDSLDEKPLERVGSWSYKHLFEPWQQCDHPR